MEQEQIHKEPQKKINPKLCTVVDTDAIIYNTALPISEIAHILKNNYEKGIDNLAFIQELKNKNSDLSFLKETLVFLISRGIPEAVQLQEDFAINTNDIELITFREGFENGKNSLRDSELLIRFINMYSNRQELLETIGEIDLILLFNLVNHYGLEFNKYNNKKARKILKEFEKTFKDKKLTDKINEIGGNDWYELSMDLFENDEILYKDLLNIFNFTDDEKEHFERLKQANLFKIYQKEIKRNIEIFEKKDFTKISEYTLSVYSEQITREEFYTKIVGLLMTLNAKNTYSITFLDISGKSEKYNIGNNIDIDGYNYNTLEINNYINNVFFVFYDFLSNLERNNMDFTILIFKRNGDRDDIPDEEYELLVA